MNINSVIRERIHNTFPVVAVSIYPDETEDNTIVAIDDELYYSDEYQTLILDIKMNFLWKQDIYNYLFVKEKHEDLLDEIASMQGEEYLAV
ncbi:hypothetical protein FACS1894137_11040 [Spirochaetia bacterium]|nr:hypothetical protein FACS1894137_11040 [Spirochaetia bacterium]